MDLWLDTSIVLRLVTKQPKELYGAARDILERAEQEGFRLHVHTVHVAEATFVLRKVYSHACERVAHDLATLLSIAVIEVHSWRKLWPHCTFTPVAVPVKGEPTTPLEEALAALHLYAAHNLDFPLFFLAEMAHTSGAGVAAFNRDCARLGVTGKCGATGVGGCLSPKGVTIVP